jgi:asparaginyl-tRNA synthetase
MDQVYIADLASHVGQSVTLRGWVLNTRSSGKIRFLILRDGTGFVQTVAGKTDISQEQFELLGEIGQESSVEVTGKVREDKRAPGGYEITLSGLTLIVRAEDFPITPKEHGSAFLLDHRHLWLRSRKQHAIMKVRHHAISAIRDFLNNRGFYCLDTPIFTPNACEGTSTLFETDYFGDKAYLSQSGQLYNEATAAAFGRVYCFGPTFRAEKSKTRRHLTEFWMIEPEIAFADLEMVMGLAEKLVVAIVKEVLAVRRHELEALEREVEKLERIQAPFPVISYDEALEILREAGEEVPWGEDFGAGQESIISNHFDRPVMIHRYPTEAKAFYMKSDPGRSEVVLCLDMLAPEGYGEIIGGGQREDDLGVLQEKIEKAGLPTEDFRWYLDIRRYGSVPHGGFGLGIERVVAWLCGLGHVRETIPFPRLMDRLYP